jgi:hypothetical protein
MELDLSEFNKYAGLVEAFGSVISTLIVSWIAVVTYRFTKAQSEVSMIKHLNDVIK